MRWPQHLVRGLLVTILVAVPPLALLYYSPVPLFVPSQAQLRQWLADPVTDQTLQFAFTAAAWLVWFLLAATIVLRFLARLQAGARWLRRIPLPTPMQATASGMAGAAFLAIPGASNATPLLDAHQGGSAAGDILDRSTVQDPLPSDREGEAKAPVDGVPLPGGWIPAHTAQQIGAAATLLWLRRRRAYRPGVKDQPGDADLADLPATVRAVQAALPSLAAQPVPATRPETGWLPLSLHNLPAGGVGLTGAGAESAARGALVTALLAARPTSSPLPRIITTRGLLARLFGPDDVGDLPGLLVAATASEAVAAVRRAPVRPSSATDVSPDPTAVRDGDGALLLLSAPTEPEIARTIAAVSRAGADLAAVVLLGGWPSGTTWQVDASGHTADPRRPHAAGHRLCVLDATAAADLLTVIRHTATPTPATEPATAVSRARIPRQSTPASQSGSSQRAAPLRLRILGEPELRHGEQVLTIRRSAVWQVLVFLAVHPDGATTRDLVTAIWPGLPMRTVTGRLYTTLSDLRTITRTAAAVTVIAHTDERYRLLREHLEVDLWRLRDAARHAATAVEDVPHAWRAVIDSYTGDLASGRVWPWIDRPREATRRLVLDAYGHLADTAPDPQTALAFLRQCVRIDPYNDELHRQAAHLLTAAGDYAAATDLANQYARRLTDTGLEPAERLLGEPLRGRRRVTSRRPTTGDEGPEANLGRPHDRGRP
ncbi:hypothetical protein ACFFWC_21760 [Plantactinospora siamensis]|uniref:Bacterial transcriptional activator domain-containing protein n=1 Tax=Plantactinospora siamensis TaxID=555372 RepID=A0ABV6P5D2_9ACTN